MENLLLSQLCGKISERGGMSKLLKDGKLHYTACGLDYVYLKGGFTIHETEYGNGFSIKEADELHRTIGKLIVCQLPVLQAAEVRFLRSLMKQTQESLAALLGVGLRQYKRYEDIADNSHISGAADHMLRSLFLNFADGNKNLIECLERISQLDQEIAKHRMILDENSEGWHQAA